MIRIEVNGNEYENFVSASCELRLDSIASGFQFQAALPGGQPLPFKGGELCRVTVDGERVLTGHIEIVSVEYSGSDHVINISGRSKPADLLDSTLDAISDIDGNELSLKRLIEIVVASIGLDVKVIDQVNPPVLTAAEDLASPEPGDNAFQFIEKFSRKRQVLLISDADGNIVITKNSGIQAVGAVQHIIGADDNNVINSSFSYDTTGRYNFYRISSGLNVVPLGFAGDVGLSSVVSQGGGVSDPGIRPGRQLVLVPETPYSDTPSEARAKWEADVRRARGLAYSATVPGFRVGWNKGDLWRINRIYQIVDDFVGKVEPMLCNAVVYSVDNDNGSNTALSFVGQNAYTDFQEPEPTSEEAANVA